MERKEKRLLKNYFSGLQPAANEESKHYGESVGAKKAFRGLFQQPHILSAQQVLVRITGHVPG
jgi:hypothetical protein